jgi:putative DNA primase/helicase
MTGWQEFCERMPTDAEQQSWLVSRASGNIGLPLGPASGLAVVDIDVEDPALIEEICACLPDSPWVRVGKKGRVLAVRYDPDISAFKLRDPETGTTLVEYLSTGNQVCLTGSIHPDTGQPYTSNTNLWEVLDQIPATPADIKERLGAVLGLEEPKRRTAPSTSKAVAEGGRHTSLTQEAGRLRNMGLEPEQLLAALRAYNEQHCNPPQDDTDVERIARDAVEKWSGGDGFPFSDIGNAKRLVERFEGHVRYETSRRAWIVFDGVCWREDSDGHVTRLAKQVALDLVNTAGGNKGQRKWGARSQSASAIRSMIDMAKSEPDVCVSADVFDLDPYLLNTPAGVCDLRTATVRPATPEDYLTKCTAVGFDAAAKCPRWLRFLEEVFPDPALRSFMQPLLGYIATGLTVEHIGVFALGSGRNGKGVTFNTLAWLLGSYSANTRYATFMQSPTGSATPELAVLKGARLVLANEGNRDQRLDSALFKSMTGGDPITARPLYQQPVTFQPQFTPLIVSNYMPEMDGNDPALWARAVLLPFTRTFEGEGKDRDLPELLRSEGPGILRWIVEGAAQYLQNGLAVPPCVTEAVAAYRGEMDVIGAFLNECCTVSPAAECSASLLYQEFERFARELAVRIPSRMEFGTELGRRGHPARKSGIVYRQGLTLKPVDRLRAAA